MTQTPETPIDPLMTADELAYEMEISPELALDFFATYSRFEFSLVAAGIFVWKDNNTVDLDLPKFCRMLDECSLQEAQKIETAGAYLIERPPKLLGKGANGTPDFCIVPRLGSKKPVYFVFECVNNARNNMFHGSKNIMPDRAGDPKRNEHVLTSALNVIRTVLETAPFAKVREKFNQRC